MSKPWVVSTAIGVSVAAHIAAIVGLGFIHPVPKRAPIDVMFLPGAVEPYRPEPEKQRPPPRPRRESELPESEEPADGEPAPRPVGPHINADPNPNPSESAVVVPLTGFRDSSHEIASSGRGQNPSDWLGVREAMPPPDKVDRVRREGPRAPPPGSGLEAHGFTSNGDGTYGYVDPLKRCGKPPRPCFKAKLHRDGRLVFARKVQILGPPGLSSILNRQKAELMKQTRELRMKMALRFAREQLDARLGTLRKEMGGVWARTSVSEARRREIIFERWDECEEPGPPELPGFGKLKGSELDSARVNSGKEARATIERWVRKKLPKGSAQAFSSDELRLLNTRRESKAKFNPYR